MKLKKDKTAAQIVALSRAPEKITTPELIKGLFADFIEFHGDRNYQDDQAIVAGIGTFKKKPVTIIATDKGVSPRNALLKISAARLLAATKRRCVWQNRQKNLIGR